MRHIVQQYLQAGATASSGDDLMWARAFHQGKPPADLINIAPAERIMSLRYPLKKMSKSEPSTKTRISIAEHPESIREKIKGAMTDTISSPLTYEPATRPGLANLFEIMSSFDESGRTPRELAQEYQDSTFLALKETIAEVVIDGLSGVRAEYERLMAAGKGKYLDHVASQGAEKARQSAEETMTLVRQAVGL